MLNTKEREREVVVFSGPDYSFILDPGLRRVMESVEMRVISNIKDGRMRISQLPGNQAFLKILHTNSSETRGVFKEAVDWGIMVPLVETARGRDRIMVRKYLDPEKLRRFALYFEIWNRCKQHNPDSVWPWLVLQEVRRKIGTNSPLEELRF
ncbi:MAG: hypothetical protein G01um10145_430 [Microgenomates group bacterium Gr01-1014_5]|nr:MAG: hypothetical protein G01um10145_430 [Microgenomates group bacterium Gr01-1014_5]